MKLPQKSLYSLILGVVLVVAVFTAILLGLKIYKFSQSTKDEIDSSVYQAVFLDNGQVYFGKLSKTETNYPVLRNVYYVKLENGSAADSNNATPGHLVKLGETEAHGPQNEMILNRQHILFWENMKANSQVMRFIEQLQSR